MRQLPKAIPELDGGLFLPLAVVAEPRRLLRMRGQRLPQPPARELLGLAAPREELVARNLLRG